MKLVITWGLILVFGYGLAPGLATSAPSFTADGMLMRPEGYRKWVYIGTPLTPNDLNEGKAPFPEFHNVYMDPQSFDHYEKTGEFREGAMLVKELVSVGSKQAVSGKGYFMGGFLGLETAVKSAKRFPNEPGNWAYFSFGHAYPLKETATALPTTACSACHAASAKQDFVFTQYYPILRAVKEKVEVEGRAFPTTEMNPEAMMAAALQPTAVTETVSSVVPTDLDALFAYLQAGQYKTFAVRESATHPSAGPHTRYGLPVRVYLDHIFDDSLRAGRASHPVGASAVKELYDDRGALQGWAVMVKTQADSAGGKGWFWYEVTSTTEGSRPVAGGNGVPLCFGCHATGKDYFLSRYPLK